MFRDFGADAYGSLDRKTSEAGPLGTTGFGYDLASRRTSITYPSTTALTIDYAYLVTGELDTIKQSTTVLADYGYDNLGNRTSAALGNGASQAFTYDPVSRLASLTNALTDTNDLSATFAYNPASQITANVRTGDMYAWTGHGNGSTAYVSNGLNQQTSIGGAAATWDSKGNLTSEPQTAKTYGYSSENLLTSASGGVTLGYDPALRLYQTVSGATTTRFLYDGFNAIAEYSGSNALQRRFVFDPTTGQPVLWYEGTGTAATNRRYLSQDERGSVISVSGSTGSSLGLNTYDEYGKPGTVNLGRYQYTGQKWIGEAGLYDYKFRDYLPHLGIFAQTDPIGYAGGPNLYAYVRNDPVNLVDPLGLCNPDGTPRYPGENCAPIIVTACQNGGVRPYCIPPLLDFGIGSSGGGRESGGGGGEGDEDQCPSNVNLEGTVTVLPAGPTGFSGTLTDVSTGQAFSVNAFGFGGGAVAGTYSVTATVKGFGALNSGFDIKFAVGPWGTGGATFTTNNGVSIGQGSVSPSIAPPIGAGVASFDPPAIRQQKAGPC